MLDYVILPLVLWVAVTAAVADWRTGKIPNRYLKLGLLFGLEWTAVLVVWLALGGPGRSGVITAAGPWGTLAALTLNGAVAFALSLLLWWVGVWAAGDAKLFSLLAFLLPHGFYSQNLLPVFPSFVLFFNTFICLTAILLVELVIKVTRSALKPGFRGAARESVARARRAVTAKGWGLVRVVGGFAAIFMTTRVTRHFARDVIGAVVPLNRTLLYVVLFLMFSPLSRLFARPRVFAGAVVAIVAYTVYAFGFSSDPELRGALIHIGWMSLSIVALGWLYEMYTGAAEVRETPVASVSPGMLLSAQFLRDLKSNSRFNNQRMGNQGPDGLTAHQVETLQTWYAKNDPEGTEAQVELATTIPFAPAMLIAVIVTVVLHGYIFEVTG